MYITNYSKQGKEQHKFTIYIYMVRGHEFNSQSEPTLYSYYMYIYIYIYIYMHLSLGRNLKMMS